MPFPSTSTNSLELMWATIKAITGNIKNQCVSLASLVTITRKKALDYQNFLADSLASLDSLTANATTNGLLAYAQAQENNPSLDLVGTYSTMRTQIVANQDWMVTNFPHTGTELLVYSFDGNKRFADINLTAPQQSAFVTQLNALAATIS